MLVISLDTGEIWTRHLSAHSQGTYSWACQLLTTVAYNQLIREFQEFGKNEIIIIKYFHSSNSNKTESYGLLSAILQK